MVRTTPHRLEHLFRREVVNYSATDEMYEPALRAITRVYQLSLSASGVNQP